jgi:uncharacterized protein
VAIHLLDPVQLRVLGCLLEKGRTTPDQYPLSLNALRLACNQATSREPVVDYDESTVREAVQRLGTIGWSRLASGPGSRTAKYRQLFDEVLDLLPSESAILAVLLLRGPQTVAELKARAERQHHFGDAAEVEATLGRLAERELVRLLPRRPGHREERWTHLLADDLPPVRAVEEQPGLAEEQVGAIGEQAGLRAAEPGSLEGRLARVEARLAAIEAQLADG